MLRANPDLTSAPLVEGKTLPSPGQRPPTTPRHAVGVSLFGGPLTTTTELAAENATLADLCEALRHARITHKRLVLRADAANIPAIKARIAALVAAYEAARDRDIDTAPRVDNSTYATSDLSYGFHILPGGRRPTT